MSDHQDVNTSPNNCHPLRASRHDRSRLTQLMLAMAAGDKTAFGSFRTEFDYALVGEARARANELGHYVDEAAVASLATDFALEIEHCAGGWRPGASLPWVWARSRLRFVARRELNCGGGPEPIDGASPEWCRATEDGDVLDLLHRLATQHAEVGELLARLETSGVSRDKQLVWLEFEQQQAQGDPSPAQTVARLYGLNPANVRQIVRRVRTRVGVIDAVAA